MKPTPELIEALANLEAHYIYNATGISENRDIGFDLLPAAFASLLLHYEDRAQYKDCVRIMRAILDAYAPRQAGEVEPLNPEGDSGPNHTPDATLDSEAVKWNLSL